MHNHPAVPADTTVIPDELVALRQIAEAAKEIAACPECMKALHYGVADKLRTALDEAGMTGR